ncbi:MAG TPA: hypothetical protein VGO90_13190 [Chthoniobacteraceae bacterium]|jgi:hypothetical protein|nr:hypothetical protein [Chthoniobacter sp.]HEV7868634.1 hypothetical protein [Chthoniobacteraceae bacterium]
MKALALFAVAVLTAVSLHAEDPATFEVGGLTFKRPAAWGWVQVSSPMRKAQLKVPGSKPDQNADITFFHFGAGGGGDIDANTKRWLGQFRSAAGAEKTEAKEIAGKKVTLVSTQGTFSSGMPGGPTTPLENQALLGAIVDGGEGNVFIKMTGPAEVVNGAREPFLQFITDALTAKK